MTALAAGFALVGALQGKIVSLATASVSFVFHVSAVRLIAGEGYATASAMFRAQRAHARQVKRLARELREQK